MEIVEIEIIKLDGYNKGVKTSMVKYKAEELEKLGKIKIKKNITSNKLAPQVSEKKAENPKENLKAEAKGKKNGGKK